MIQRYHFITNTQLQTHNHLSKNNEDQLLSNQNYQNDFLKDIQNIIKKNPFQMPTFQIQEKNTNATKFTFTKFGCISVGMYGSVYKVYQQKLKACFALKTISKNFMKQNLNYIINEIKIQMFVTHQNIIKLQYFYFDEYHINLVQQLMIGNNLYKHMQIHKKIGLSQIKKIGLQIIKALNYLHSLKIVHRDIKPQNIIVSDLYQVKVCDFGFSYYKQTSFNQFVGTLDYSSPQMILGQEYNQKIDIWGFGIILYQLCFNKNPMENLNSTQKMFFLMNYNNDSICYEGLDCPDLVLLIKGCLQKNKKQRWSTQKILKTKWLNFD